MDGNGRWSKEKFGRNRIFGHMNGVNAVRAVTEASRELGIKYLTLYTFSTENWNRPTLEVNALMELLVNTIKKETAKLSKNGVRLNVIGEFEKLPPKCQENLNEAIEATKHNDGLLLTLALSYSSRWELTKAIRTLATDAKSGKINPEDITEDLIHTYLETKNIPDPELLIRTSGEYRISNYMLWQIAYSELYFTPVFWPDFDKNEYYKAIIEFQKRERRFGKTGEQLAAQQKA
ncbi:UNVERIFIED_CONTAM: hypothetical protein GTU68_018094 [Idotea baltica]|nr:hypothetical protein [Idotea baltica]